MGNLTIHREPLNEDVIHLDIEGYLDAQTYEDLEEEINDLFDENHHRIVIDLSEVDYISSAGAGVFIGAIGTARDHSGDIILLNPTENVREVFELLGLSEIFVMAEDEDQAIAEFEGQ